MTSWMLSEHDRCTWLWRFVTLQFPENRCWFFVFLWPNLHNWPVVHLCAVRSLTWFVPCHRSFYPKVLPKCNLKESIIFVFWTELVKKKKKKSCIRMYWCLWYDVGGIPLLQFSLFWRFGFYLISVLFIWDV